VEENEVEPIVQVHLENSHSNAGGGGDKIRTTI